VSSVEQHRSSDQLNCGEEISGELIVTRGDAPKVLEFVEEALDEVAFAVEREVAFALGLAVGLGRDHRNDVARREGIDERIGIIGLVGNAGLRIDVFQQRLCASEIVRLSRRQHQAMRIAQGVDQGMDFGSQSAARSADRLFAVFFRAPALC
jgi:hypothetical protein